MKINVILNLVLTYCFSLVALELKLKDYMEITMSPDTCPNAMKI